VEEVVSNKDLLSLAAEGADDISETGVVPWSWKTQEARKDEVQNWWMYMLEGLCVNSELWLWF